MGKKTDLDDTALDSQKTADETNELSTFEDTNDGDEIQAPSDPRAEMMAQMVANSKEARDESQREFLESHKEPEQELETEPEPEVEEIVDKPVKQDDNPVYVKEGKQHIKLKVNGVDTEIAIDDAIVRLQKGENLDLKTLQADKERQKYIDLQTRLQQQKQSTPPDDTQAAANPKALKDALTKIYDGDLDEATEALAAVITNAKSKSQPVNIDAQVAKALDNSKLREAYGRFSKDPKFESVVNDKTLLSQVNEFTVTLQKDQEFMSQNPSYDDFFREAGERTLKWINGISGQPPQTKPDEIDTRQERKRNKAKPVVQKTVRRGPKPEAEPSKSSQDIIRDIARKRGQTNF